MSQSFHQDSNKDSYKARLREYIAQNANPPHKFGHQPRLYLLACQIGAQQEYDDDIVFASTWLHDLGVFIGHRPEDPARLAVWDHVAYTVDRSPALLLSMGFPAAKVPAVLDVIRSHQPKDEPLTLEGIIVRDADLLEQLGAIGIFRTASKLGSDGRFVRFTDAEQFLARALVELPQKIRLESTRRLAKPRILLLQQFLADLKAEALGELG